jgi:hypothetical protein
MSRVCRSTRARAALSSAMLLTMSRRAILKSQPPPERRHAVMWESCLKSVPERSTCVPLWMLCA